MSVQRKAVSQMKYKVGQLVVNKKLGIGKVLSVSGLSVTAYFRDQKENPRTINVGVVPMPLAPEQSDPMLDGVDERGKLKSRQRKGPAMQEAEVAAPPVVSKVAKVTRAEKVSKVTKVVKKGAVKKAKARSR